MTLDIGANRQDKYFIITNMNSTYDADSKTYYIDLPEFFGLSYSNEKYIKLLRFYYFADEKIYTKVGFKSRAICDGEYNQDNFVTLTSSQLNEKMYRVNSKIKRLDIQFINVTTNEIVTADEGFIIECVLIY